MIQKEFIPYEEALALKELGFDEPCFSTYRNKILKFPVTVHNDKNGLINSTISKFGDITAPTFSQTFRWFREKYEYEISIHKLIEEDGYMSSIGWEGVEDIMEQVEGTTYEEAELECLRKLIQIVKNKL